MTGVLLRVSIVLLLLLGSASALVEDSTVKRYWISGVSMCMARVGSGEGTGKKQGRGLGMEQGKGTRGCAQHWRTAW